MSLKKCPAMAMLILFFLLPAAPQICAQEAPRFEIGAHVTALDLGDFRLRVPDISKSERGAGGRITFNINDNVSIEGEVNIFPEDFRISLPSLGQLVTRRLTKDRVNQYIIGVKAGFRSRRFGFFGKLRPGYVDAELRDETVNSNSALNSVFRTSSGAMLDAGIVLEFYPTRHTMLRLDVGDTIIRFRTEPIAGNTTSNAVQTGVFRKHSIQVSAGFGFRF
jgi:hypothetical protein